MKKSEPVGERPLGISKPGGPGGALPYTTPPRPRGCHCPCDLGRVVPESDPVIYHGGYTVSRGFTGDGGSHVWVLPWLVNYVPGTLTLMSLPTGLFIAVTETNPAMGSFTATIPNGDEGFAMYRAACTLHEPPGG